MNERLQQLYGAYQHYQDEQLRERIEAYAGASTTKLAGLLRRRLNEWTARKTGSLLAAPARIAGRVLSAGGRQTKKLARGIARRTGWAKSKAPVDKATRLARWKGSFKSVRRLPGKLVGATGGLLEKQAPRPLKPWVHAGTRGAKATAHFVGKHPAVTGAGIIGASMRDTRKLKKQVRQQRDWGV